MSAGIPLADAVAFRQRAAATRALMATLGAGAVLAAAGVLLASRSPHSQTLLLPPSNANVVVVLDLSASIASETYPRIGGTLQVLSRSRGRVGLVLFSDDAYEALPAGTPAADLAPMLRYFTVPHQSPPGVTPLYPLNPWGSTFTGGTNISAAIEMAIQMAVAQRPRATVMLVSDLDDNPNNLPALTAVGAVARHDHVPVRLIGLNPSRANVAYFRSVFGRAVPVIEAPTRTQATREEHTPFPWPLLALTLVAAIVLALREGWAPRLSWRQSR